MDGEERGQIGTVPDGYLALVKDALEHLYDLAHLQHHSLAAQLPVSPADRTDTPGHRLRSSLAAAVEALSPGPNIPFGSPAVRAYNLIRLRYVEGLTVKEAAAELSLSLRQTHRELRRAEESVAATFWEQSQAADAGDAQPTDLSTVGAELARLDGRSIQVVDLGALVESAVSVVAPQAAHRGVEVRFEQPREPVALSMNRVIGEQVLVNLISIAVRQAHPGPLVVSVEATEGGATVTLEYYPSLAAGDAPLMDLSLAQLVDQLRWNLRQREREDSIRVVELQAPCGGPTVLVVDDNEGLVELVQRYLADQACRVVAATNGDAGLRLARSIAPDTVIVDLMMPGMHGWELLQRLGSGPDTADIPVIVCSVISNPELAYSLGAKLFLPKPVSRSNVLEALHSVGVL